MHLETNVFDQTALDMVVGLPVVARLPESSRNNVIHTFTVHHGLSSRDHALYSVVGHHVPVVSAAFRHTRALQSIAPPSLNVSPHDAHSG